MKSSCCHPSCLRMVHWSGVSQSYYPLEIPASDRWSTQQGAELSHPPLHMRVGGVRRRTVNQILFLSSEQELVQIGVQNQFFMLCFLFVQSLLTGMRQSTHYGLRTQFNKHGQVPGFESRTSAIPAQCSDLWAIRPLPWFSGININGQDRLRQFNVMLQCPLKIICGTVLPYVILMSNINTKYYIVQNLL